MICFWRLRGVASVSSALVLLWLLLLAACAAPENPATPMLYQGIPSPIVFSFNQVAAKPSRWQAFLGWLGW